LSYYLGFVECEYIGEDPGLAKQSLPQMDKP